MPNTGPGVNPWKWNRVKAHEEWKRMGGGKSEWDVREALGLTIAALAAQ